MILESPYYIQTCLLTKSQGRLDLVYDHKWLYKASFFSVFIVMERKFQISMPLCVCRHGWAFCGHGWPPTWEYQYNVPTPPNFHIFSIMSNSWKLYVNWFNICWWWLSNKLGFPQLLQYKRNFSTYKKKWINKNKKKQTADFLHKEMP